MAPRRGLARSGARGVARPGPGRSPRRRGMPYGLRARTIAELACGCTRWVSRISMSVRPASASALELRTREAPAMQPVHWRMSARVASSIRIGDHVGHREATSRHQHPCGLAQDRALVPGQVDHAVRDHHVDGLVWQRDLLDVALHELDVLDARVGGVGAGELEHLVGHVEADRPARSAPTLRAEMRTSAPAPEPRSRTVSPSWRSQLRWGRRSRARRPRPPSGAASPRPRRALRRRPRCPRGP